MKCDQLTAAEVKALIAAAESAIKSATTSTKKRTALRDLAMIQTILLAGLKLAEVCGLKIEDIDMEGMTLRIVGASRCRQGRMIPMNAKLRSAIKRYLGTREEGYAFLGPKSRPLSHRRFGERVRELGKAAGIKKVVHPNLLRHRFSEDVSGLNVAEIGDVLGVEVLSATAMRQKSRDERKRSIIDSL